MVSRLGEFEAFFDAGKAEVFLVFTFAAETNSAQGCGRLNRRVTRLCTKRKQGRRISGQSSSQRLRRRSVLPLPAINSVDVGVQKTNLGAVIIAAQ